MNRRGFMLGLAGLAAPAIIRTPGLLMPIRSPWVDVGQQEINREVIQLIYNSIQRNYPVLGVQSIIGARPIVGPAQRILCRVQTASISTSPSRGIAPGALRAALAASLPEEGR
jgi:hypothetical protein